MAAPPSVGELEAAFLTAWPGVKTVLDGLWIWRFAHGYTKRANAAQSLDAADDHDAGSRLDRLVDLSRRHGIAPLFRVTPLAGAGVLAALDDGHWQAFEQSRVLAMRLDRSMPSPSARTHILAANDPRWIAEQARLSDYDAPTTDLLAEMTGLIAPPAAGVLASDSAGKIVAAALAVQTGRIGVYLNVVVDRARRGEGHGRSVMQAALRWTQAEGATHAAIQVLASNSPALGLYTSLGFVDVYGYDYRRPAG